MEVGFLVIMVGLVIIMATVVSLFRSEPYHTCGNCKNFTKAPGSKRMGKCPLRLIVFDYEDSCKHFKK